MSKFIFHFTFSIDSDELEGVFHKNEDKNDELIEKHYAFLCENSNFENFSFYSDNQDFEEFMYKAESEFGVHDFINHPVDGINAFGLCSYEVETDKIIPLMHLWRETFKKIDSALKISQIFELNDEEMYNDLSILTSLEKKILEQHIAPSSILSSIKKL